jgi:hypothetical protein
MAKDYQDQYPTDAQIRRYMIVIAAWLVAYLGIIVHGLMPNLNFSTRNVQRSDVGEFVQAGLGRVIRHADRQ